MSSTHGDRLPQVLIVMVASLTPAAREELRRALHFRLFPELTARQRREGELGCLARLLRERGRWPEALSQDFIENQPETRVRRRALSPRESWPTISRTDYDAWRDGGALSAKALMERHRANWVMVCRAAASLEIDGLRLSRGASWASPHRGGPGTRSRDKYTRLDCIDGVLRCAAALGREPDSITSSLYINWSVDQRRRARARARTRDQLAAVDPRLPNWDVVRLRFGGWAALMRAVRRDLARLSADLPGKAAPASKREGRRADAA
jgi:hypothetical protein